MRKNGFRLLIAGVAGLSVGIAVILAIGTAFDTVAAPSTASAANNSTPLGTSKSENDPSLNAAAKVSALKQLPALKGAVNDKAETEISVLNLGSAIIKPGSVRRAENGMLLAQRGKDVCYVGRFASGCIFAFDRGGIKSWIQEERKDSSSLISIDGIAVDGVATVGFEFKNGSVVIARVVDNVFQLSLDNVNAGDIVANVVDGVRYELPSIAPHPIDVGGTNGTNN